ncbi:MAG TPA: Nif11-like leader peptide family RiPP precursor [Thermoanaerobaculia bacterium]|nr:Nif11-like leader peptide family RiPP precursor [Thermoanaerobaculia bacterium]
MSESDVQRFLTDLRKAPHLVPEIRALLDDPEAALRWAEGRGFHLTREDLAELKKIDQELSDDDLDQVAGGDNAWTPPPH